MPRSLPLLFALAALLVAAPAAQACPDQTLSRPFTPWLDFAQYQAAPDGGLESGAVSWTLNGASTTDGGQPWGGGSRSLAIPAGASAVTAPICITPSHPAIRFFARGSGVGVLAVSVIADGGLELPVGTVLGLGTSWAPSPAMAIVLNLLGERNVQFRFSGTLGSFRIDDVWVDPYSKG